MTQPQTTMDGYGLRRVYEVNALSGGGKALRLGDRIVELGAREHELYAKVAEGLAARRAVADWERELGLRGTELEKLFTRFSEAGLLYPRATLPKTMTGVEFHKLFNGVLESWLAEAFSHPFWERMMSGKGSARLFTGWLHRALPLHEERQPPHAALVRATPTRRRSSSCAPSTTPRSGTTTTTS